MAMRCPIVPQVLNNLRMKLCSVNNLTQEFGRRVRHLQTDFATDGACKLARKPVHNGDMRNTKDRSRYDLLKDKSLPELPGNFFQCGFDLCFSAKGLGKVGPYFSMRKSSGAVREREGKDDN